MADRYPEKPGFYAHAPETSAQAAESVAEAAKTRSAMALRFITQRGRYGATSDECADRYEWERYSSRPRIAELRKQGVIVDSGNRREGASGRRQAVWVAKQFAAAEPAGAQGELPGVL